MVMLATTRADTHGS